MKRSLILVGDRTTSGGVVLDGEATATAEGKPLSFHGARVQCPKCHSLGHIVGVGPRWPMAFMSQQAALENDLCLCRCDPPPRLIASQSAMYMTFESEDLASMGFAANGLGLSPQDWGFLAFRLPDEGSAQGLRGTAHFEDGSTASGSFDHQNVIRFENPSGKVCTRLTIDADVGEVGGTLCSAFLETLTA